MNGSERIQWKKEAICFSLFLWERNVLLNCVVSVFSFGCIFHMIFIPVGENKVEIKLKE